MIKERLIAFHLAPIEYVPLIMSQGLLPQTIKNKDHAVITGIRKGLYLWEHFNSLDRSSTNNISDRDKKIITDLIFAKNFYHPRNIWSFLYIEEMTKLYGKDFVQSYAYEYCNNIATQLYYESFKNYIFMRVTIPERKKDIHLDHTQEHQDFPNYSHKDKHILLYTKRIPPQDIELLCVVKASIKNKTIVCAFKNIKNINKYYLTEENIKKYSKKKLY